MTEGTATPRRLEAGAGFEPYRRHLTGLAYRMLGSVAEAEDVVQDAFLRWQASDRATIDNPRAYLSRVVTRLSLDQLKSARRRREVYIGPWLPDPLIAAAGTEDPTADDFSADLSVALLLALERLSPLERAAFLLHDIFDSGFDEVATILGRSAAACRQLAARARAHVAAARPRFPLDPAAGAALADAFLTASRSGDTAILSRLLAEEAVLYTDGGGKRRAALNPVFGRARVARFFAGLARKQAPPAVAEVIYRGSINGLPGFLLREADGHLQSTALDIRNGQVVAVYIVRNPDKLAHLLTITDRSADYPPADRHHKG